MIPAERYSPAAADQLLQYLIAELDRAKSERRPLEDRWMRFQRLYRTEPEVENKTFPFPGCSNVEIGLIASDVDTVYSRLMAMLFTPPNLWTCRPLRPEMQTVAPKLEEFLEWAQKNEVHMQDPTSDWILELCKLGTGVLKTRYNRETKKVYEFREVTDPYSGGIRRLEQQVRKIIKDSPKVHHVSLYDFYVPASACDLQYAPWCAERINLSWPQFVNRVKAGIYSNNEAVSRWRATDRGSNYERRMQELDSFVPSRGNILPMHEFWVDWDIDGDGEQEALVCTIHTDSRAMVRLDFNPFFNQEKPYDIARYMRQEKRFYGIGIAEMLEPLQDEVSTMHNQRIDNNTIANAQVVVALRTGNIKQGEPIFPGRVLLVDTMDEVKMLPMGVIAHSTIQDEAVTVGYAKQRTGVNDYISGADNASVGYSSATTAVQQLREGQKRFDQVLREVRTALSGVGTKVLELYQQFSQGQKAYLALGAKDGTLVTQVLTFPLEIIRAGVLVDVTATSASYNKEVEIRTNTIMLQMLTQYYTQLLQALQIVVNPQMPELLRQTAWAAVKGGSILMKRILDDYGMQDSDEALPGFIDQLTNAQQQLGAQLGSGFGGPQAASPYTGGSPMVQGYAGQSQLAAVSGQFAAPPQQFAQPVGIGGGY